MHEGRIFKKLYPFKGYTQESLAERLGVSRQTIVNWAELDTLPVGRRHELEKLFGVKFTEIAASEVDKAMPSTQEASPIINKIQHLEEKVNKLQETIIDLQRDVIKLASSKR